MAEPTTAIPTGGEDETIVNDPAGQPTFNGSSADETRSALDEALKAAIKVKGDEPIPVPAVVAPPDKKDEAGATAPETPKAGETELSPAPKPAVATETFEAVEPPPHAKPKTAEAFAKIKQLAKQQLDSVNQELETVRTKLQEVEKKVGEGLPLETKKELEDLRAFRQRLEVESDPQFKVFDGKVKENEEAIYSKLKGAGVADDVIKKISEFGGPSQVDWESIWDKLSPQVKRYIENKLFENEDLTAKKTQAIEAAKNNVTEFMAAKQTESVKSREQARKVVRSTYEEMLPKMEWLKDKTPAKDAKPEEIAAAKEHNKIVSEIRKSVDEVIADDSPEMRGVLVLGYAQLQKVRADYAAFKTSSTAEIESLKKSLKDSESMLERIKKSSSGRLRESGAPAPGTAPAASKKINPNISTREHLDNLLAEAQAAAEANA